MTSLLEVSDLVAGYGGATVLHGVSLRIDPGETVVVLGPNGHGKSTLLRALSGLVPLYDGKVTLGQIDLTGRPAYAIASAGLIHVPQGDLVFPEMTVLENLLMGCYQKDAWRARSESLRRVFALFPPIAERQRQLARSLSGGERRMLAIWRGLMAKARLLVLDEPSMGLAPLVVEDVYKAIASIKESGLSILLVDENADNVGGLADRIYLLEAGQIAREGKTAELFGDQALLSAYLG